MWLFTWSWLVRAQVRGRLVDKWPWPEDAPPLHGAPCSVSNVHAAAGRADAHVGPGAVEPAPAKWPESAYWTHDRANMTECVRVCVCSTCAVVLGNCVAYWMESTEQRRNSAAPLWTPCSGSAVSAQQQEPECLLIENSSYKLCLADGLMCTWLLCLDLTCSDSGMRWWCLVSSAVRPLWGV